jgi:predicted permease
MRLPRFFRRLHRDEDLRREIEQHLALERELNLARGLNSADARRLAYIKFGSRQKVFENTWRNNSFVSVEKIIRDLRYAFRTLRRSPGYTLMAIFTLALGIGANTAIFTVIDGVLLRPLPYGNPQQIVHLRQTATLVGPDSIDFSVQEVADYRQQSRAFSDLAEYHSMTFTLLGTKVPERVVTGVVSANYFKVLDVKPVLGRLITPADETLNAAPVLVLSYDYWVKEFGADPKILGHPFTMNDRVHTVIGVLGPVPGYPDANDVYMPTTSCPFRSDPRMIANRDSRMLTILARLKPGVTAAQAQNDLATIYHRLEHTYPKSYPAGAGIALTVVPVQNELTHAARPTFLMLLAAAGLVLLLACANLANLGLSRQLQRARETAVRLAAGASTMDIFRQTMIENLVVAFAGGVLGLGMAAAGVRLLVAYAARMTPLSSEIHLDGRVLLFGLGTSLLTGVLFGSLPAMVAARSKLGILAGSAEKTAGSETGSRTREILVAAQVAFSFVLLVCAGLMMRSLYNLLSVDPGFKTANVLSMNISLNWTKYDQLTKQNSFFHQIVERAQQIPGTEAVAMSTSVPLNSDRSGMNGAVLIEGRPVRAGEIPPQIDHQLITPDYFRVLGTPLLSGRTFTAADTIDAGRVTIVNAQMAKHYWPGQDPLGRHISTDGKTWITIVGVVSNVHQYGLDKSFDDAVYFPQAQTLFMGSPHLLVRTRGEPTRISGQVVTIIQQIDSEQPVSDIRTLDQLRSAQLGTPRVTSALLGTFAGVALFITIVGVTGTLALSVSQRTKEIGIRIALGASNREILVNVLRRGMFPVMAGIVLGVCAAVFSTRLLATMLFDVKPDDLAILIGIAVLLGTAALIGCVIPGRQATKIDPMVALRAE